MRIDLTGHGNLAAWVPNDRDGPTVIINIDSPILEELVTYHQTEYADKYAEQVAKTVYRVFSEVAACKIAHSQKLTKDISEQELNRDYRSEKALTLSLMGLIAKDPLLASDLVDCA